MAKRNYQGRISGPLLDRLDMWVSVEPVASLPPSGEPAGESSAKVAARVAQAREIQRHRFQGLGWSLNCEAPGQWLRSRLGTRRLSQSGLNRALQLGQLSLRGVDRVLRVAWTMADLAGRETPRASEIDTAMALRRRET
jgi:magnesium chelatase family protein